MQDEHIGISRMDFFSGWILEILEEEAKQGTEQKTVPGLTGCCPTQTLDQQVCFFHLHLLLPSAPF
jgi:hypothetical protein